MDNIENSNKAGAEAVMARAQPRFRVVVAAHQGMCFGVRDALGAIKAAAASGPITVLGQLVHNEVVREQLAANGIVEIRPDAEDAPTRRVAITAHGTSRRGHARWREAGYQITDTTCPLVRKAHEALAGLVALGCTPVVIGRHGHAEVLGLTGDFPGAIVVEGPADLATLPEHPMFGVVAQTTQPEARVHALVEAIRALRPTSRVIFRDTICRPTKDRQRAVEDLARACDHVVVIGGANSNNTRELAEAAAAFGRVVGRITRAEERRAADFENARVVGLTAGTSTLPATVDAVVAGLRRFANAPEAGGWPGDIHPTHGDPVCACPGSQPGYGQGRPTTAHPHASRDIHPQHRRFQ